MKTTALVLAFAAIAFAAPDNKGLVLRAISTHADRVSGGDVLIEVSGAAAVTLNGRDVSPVFRAQADGSRLGLVTGLQIGRNVLKSGGATLEITNYPLTGPIVSGPHTTPFVCQTGEFKLPDGSVLGDTADLNCTFPTKVQYLYLAQGAKDFKPLSDITKLPADVATTTTLTGVTVPFVVRVETGAMNRGIYQNTILHDPTKDPAPTPFTPPPAWNRRLIAVHGTGCPTGWYRQGGVMGVSPLNVARLGQGYAMFTNTLNHPTNSCNAFLAGETTMMGKEHFIEEFGVPLFTVSMGTSGGAYTSLQVADAFPGLFDGVIITATFPDALSIATAGLDAHLLSHYFETSGPSALTEAQKVSISGYKGLKAFVDAANQAQRTDPVPGRKDIAGYDSARWHASVPERFHYDPNTNPKGARPTVFDAAKNIYGVDPATGFARRPFDNVGVQYGLQALNDGAISVAQFLDLNEKIGGYDQDANYTATRAVGDTDALLRAYRSGVTLSGSGGLASIPVFDAGAYNDTQGYHYAWFHFAVRERLRRQNGRADNHVMWRGAVPAEQSWAVIEDWITAVKKDTSSLAAYDKVIKNKPAKAVDGCFPPAPEGATSAFVAEKQVFSSKPDSACTTALPAYSNVRHVAGGPLDASILKCQLKPVDAADYKAAFSAADLQRLKQIFISGVCDWSKPGVSQVKVEPWMSFGPAPMKGTSH